MFKIVAKPFVLVTSVILTALHSTFGSILTVDGNKNLINASYPLNSNDSCIYLQGYFTLSVPNKYHDSGYIELPEDFSVTGDCNYNDTIQMIRIDFLERWGLAFFFNKDTKDDIHLSSISVQYTNVSESNNGTEDITTFNIDTEGNVRSNILSFYQCQANISLASEYEVRIICRKKLVLSSIFCLLSI